MKLIFFGVMLLNLKKHSIKLALAFGTPFKTFCRNADDSHAQLGNRNNATEFMNICNRQNLQIQYTIKNNRLLLMFR